MGRNVCRTDQGCIAKLHGFSFHFHGFSFHCYPTVLGGPGCHGLFSCCGAASQTSFASCDSTVSGTAWAGISANRKSPEGALASSDSQYSGGTSAPVIEDPRMSTP